MPSRRESLASKVMFAALRLLDEHGGRLRIADLRREVPENTALSDWELFVLPHGRPRWQSALDWYSHEYVKAGLLLKAKGMWTITERGRKGLQDGAESMFSLARAGYLEWKAAGSCNRFRSVGSK